MFKRCLDSFQLLIKQNDAKWIIRCAQLPVKIESRWRCWKSAVAAVAGQEVYSRQKGRRWSPMSRGSIFVIQMFEFPSWKLLVFSNVKGIFSYYHDWLNLFSNHETKKKQQSHWNHSRNARTQSPPTKGLAIFGNRLLQHHGGRICTWDQWVSSNGFCWCNIFRTDTIRIDKIWWDDLSWDEDIILIPIYTFMQEFVSNETLRNKCGVIVFYGSCPLPKAKCLSKVPNARVVRGDARKEGLLQEAGGTVLQMAEKRNWYLSLWGRWNVLGGKL